MFQYLLAHRIILKEGQDFYFLLTVHSHNGYDHLGTIMLIRCAI